MVDPDKAFTCAELFGLAPRKKYCWHPCTLGQSVTCALLDSLSPAHSWTVCHPPTLGQSVTHPLLDSLLPTHSWTVCHPPTLGQSVTHPLLDSLLPTHSWTVCHPPTLGQSVTHPLLDSLSPTHSWTVCHPQHPLLDSPKYRHLCWNLRTQADVTKSTVLIMQCISEFFNCTDCKPLDKSSLCNVNQDFLNYPDYKPLDKSQTTLLLTVGWYSLHPHYPEQRLPTLSSLASDLSKQSGPSKVSAVSCHVM